MKAKLYKINAGNIVSGFTGMYPGIRTAPGYVQEAYGKALSIIEAARESGEKYGGRGWFNTFRANSQLGSLAFRVPEDEAKNVYTDAMYCIYTEMKKSGEKPIIIS